MFLNAVVSRPRSSGTSDTQTYTPLTDNADCDKNSTFVKRACCTLWWLFLLLNNVILAALLISLSMM